MESLSFTLLFLLTFFLSMMLVRRDEILLSQTRSKLMLFIHLQMQAIALIALYRLMDFYPMQNEWVYYMPAWAIYVSSALSYLLGYSFQKVFISSEKSLHNIFSLGTVLTLVAAWITGADLLIALNLAVALSAIGLMLNFNKIDLSLLNKLKLESSVLKFYIAFQAILLPIVSFYFISRLTFLDWIEYLVYISIIFLNLFQARSLLQSTRFQPIELTRILLIFLIEADYVHYHATLWFKLVMLYVNLSLAAYVLAHISFIVGQLTQTVQNLVSYFSKLTKS